MADMLLMIDGNSIMHRAFHALPPMNDKHGNPTHALYGFISMLLKLLSDLKPSHCLVCFDRPEPTFRKSMYVGYQAKRPKMDDELSVQMVAIRELILAMKIPVYEAVGYEADDLLGSLSRQAEESGFFNKIIIVTGDRDILQLVDEVVYVYMPIQGLTNAKLYGVKEVREKYGIDPMQIIDYKALAGDASDNYPGVKGIGPKTAVELLHMFHSIENMYTSIHDKTNGIAALSEKTITALSQYAEDCVMAKKLATIDRNAPATLTVQDTIVPDLDTLQVEAVFEKYGFHSLLKRVKKMSVSTAYQKKEVIKKPVNEQLSLV